MVAGPTGRGVLQIHPTRRCNLTCQHCYSSSGPNVEAMLPQRVVRELVADAALAGYDVLSVSGGEPLLYGSLELVLDDAKRVGMTTTITTNGMLLTERRLGRLAGRVDLIAISLDGLPASHNQMRRNPQAFERMTSRLPALRRSGVQFGFVFTLTQWNIHELEWVASFAETEGASLLQVHPLELEGFAVTNLPAAIPDRIELLYAAAETLRLGKSSRLYFQFDVTYRADLLREPARFMALAGPPEMPLGRWLSPLVLETDGTLVPVTYGFPHRYAIGNVADEPFGELVARWDAAAFLDLTSRTWRDLTKAGGPDALNWYETLTRRARTETASAASADHESPHDSAISSAPT